GSCKFGRYQRHRNTPEKRQHQQVDQRHARPGSRDHILQAEGSTRGVGEHYEDEIEQPGLAKSGLFLRGRARIGYGMFDMSPRVEEIRGRAASRAIIGQKPGGPSQATSIELSVTSSPSSVRF